MNNQNPTGGSPSGTKNTTETVLESLSEKSATETELKITTPLHENALIIDYLNSRFFTGFELKASADKLLLTSSDSTIMAILERAKLIKDKEEETIELDVMVLLPKRTAIKKAVRDFRWQWESECSDLLEALNAINAFIDPEVKERLKNGSIHYSDMPVLFPRGTEVIATTVSGPLGGVVETCVEVCSFFGNHYNISMTVVLPTSKGCCLGRVSHKVYDFGATITPINKLGIHPINAAEKAKLKERGETFRNFTKVPTPATYTGKIAIPGWMREHVMGADGRIMVDSINFAQVDSDIYYEMMRSFQIDEDSTTGVVRDEDLWRCYNRVHGFSMKLKRWGWLDVEGILPVKWRDDAFQQLVLSETHKKSIFHLVKYYGGSFTDFIDGKSGGLVFLLHGPTGTGKTLTAEAVAETLHRPLYSVSVGELGTSPDELEGKLRSILDLAYQWNAVLLLDEADIFMEARDTNNIQRNAMVSIFLRLLEYYSGVMFLTTNRVTSFDPAFFSRISMAISYPKLEGHDRGIVWRNVLLSSGVASNQVSSNIVSEGNEIFDLNALAKYDVNGRNIKTAVRIAQTMAMGDNRHVTQADIISVLSLTEQFNRDVKI
jgi:DNA polymerase III delta prime subunit